MAPGLFTAGAGGLCSSGRGYSTVEKAARRKVLDEHRTADGLLDEVPQHQGDRGLQLAQFASSQGSPRPQSAEGLPHPHPLLPSPRVCICTLFLPFPTHGASGSHPMVT